MYYLFDLCISVELIISTNYYNLKLRLSLKLSVNFIQLVDLNSK